MIIALLQTAIAWENKRRNVCRYSEMIASLPSGVRLVVLPEMFSTGFSMHPEMLAEENGGAALEWMRGTAVQRRLAITGSVMVEEEGRYYNRLYFVFPDGAYRWYNKRHLFTVGNEHRHYTPGVDRLIVTYEGWRICPLVCYDLRFPVFSRNAGCAYDLLLYVANWPASRIAAWDTLLAARAIENQCYTAGVNCTGTDGHGVLHNGHSQVVDFKGQVMACADGKEESAVLTVELSPAHLRAFRAQFPALDDADRFTVHRPGGQGCR